MRSFGGGRWGVPLLSRVVIYTTPDMLETPF